MLLKTKSKILDLNIEAQPDDVTCGPTCLHAVYQYYNDSISLKEVIDEVKQLPTGGTLAVQLANHALARGYNAIIYTYNLHMFDPTWFESNSDLQSKLIQQQSAKGNKNKLIDASNAYLKFLKLGGKIKFEELNPTLFKRFLSKSIPLLTGLSATYLYESAREIGDHTIIFDDVRGFPTGHFVVINGFENNKKQAFIADPLAQNPMSSNQYYGVNYQKLINSIMLGVMTYDANILIVYPK